MWYAINTAERAAVANELAGGKVDKPVPTEEVKPKAKTETKPDAEQPKKHPGFSHVLAPPSPDYAKNH